MNSTTNTDAFCISSISAVREYYPLDRFSFFDDDCMVLEPEDLDDPNRWDDALWMRLDRAIAMPSDMLTLEEALPGMRALMHAYLDQRLADAQEHSKEDVCALGGYNPYTILMNIWMCDDPALEDKWVRLVGSAAGELLARAFYGLSMVQVHADLYGSPTYGLLPRQILKRGLSESSLERIRPHLDGSYIHDAIDTSTEHFGIQGWNLYLDKIHEIYTNDPFFAFDQWRILKACGAADVQGQPYSVLSHYNIQNTSPLLHHRVMYHPDMSAHSDVALREKIVSMYDKLASLYDGDDLYRMEAVMALTGYPPPTEHPRFDGLIALFFYSVELCPGGDAWSAGHAMSQRPGAAVLHHWMDTQRLLSQTFLYYEYIDFYIDHVVHSPPDVLNALDLE